MLKLCNRNRLGQYLVIQRWKQITRHQKSVRQPNSKIIHRETGEDRTWKLAQSKPAYEKYEVHSQGAPSPAVITSDFNEAKLITTVISSFLQPEIL